MKLGIVGSITFNNYEMLVEFIQKNFNFDDITHKL